MKKIKEFIPLIYNYSQQRLSTNGCIGSPANYRGQKLAFARRQILQQSSTLIVHLYFLQVVLSVLFLKKYQKRGSRVRHSVLPLFTNCISISCCNILQSVHTSPLAACRNAWGGKNSLRSNIMPPVSKHCSAAHCASQRCPFAFSDELPFAMKRRVE